MAARPSEPEALHGSVARSIKLARKRYGTMRRFADDLCQAIGWSSLSAAAVYAWEAGATRVPAVALVAAADLVEVPLDDLLAAARAGAEELREVRTRRDALDDRVVSLEERVEMLERRIPE